MEEGGERWDEEERSGIRWQEERRKKIENKGGRTGKRGRK